MDSKDILVPSYKIVIIKDRSYKIGKLSLKQVIQLGRLFARTILSSRKKLAELSKETKDNISNAQDLAQIVGLLKDDDATELFSIILNEPDKQFLQDLPFDDAVEIIAVLCEYNKFDRVKKNFQKIQQALMPDTKTD